jgi:D-arginine dehydrogenase
VSETADIIVIGGGIAGASAAAHLAAHGRVVLLEREAQPGYHSTGRSAALFSETYGNRTIRALTRASRAYFEGRADGFAEHPILSPRGVLMYAMPGQMPALEAAWAELAPLDPAIRRLGAAETRALVPALRPDQVEGAIYDPRDMDIDVHGLHQAYLRRLRRAGGRVVTDASVTALTCRGTWRVTSTAGEFAAPVVADAAGAWADEVAELAGLPAVGLVPKRRTALLVTPPPDLDSRHWPLTIDFGNAVYFKPDAGKLLVSPVDETPMPPCDVQPEDEDVALAVDRLQRATTIAVRRVERKWAGLRSFVADHTPVVGFDPSARGFFWLAGQGGYGIQTAEGMALAAAALIVEKRLPDALTRLGLDAATLSPARFGRR